jgi:gentisate 1,2-dioxygenase
MPTIRAEFHRLRAGASTEAVREVGSSVWQVFEGSGSVVLNGETRTLAKGDLFVVPSWTAWSLQADLQAGTEFDLFRFSDAPIFERLNFNRTYTEGRNK